MKKLIEVEIFEDAVCCESYSSKRNYKHCQFLSTDSDKCYLFPGELETDHSIPNYDRFKKCDQCLNI